MANLRFSTRDEAASFLLNCGFVFMGAPDRWRSDDRHGVTYAVIFARNDTWYLSCRRTNRGCGIRPPDP